MVLFLVLVINKTLHLHISDTLQIDMGRVSRVLRTTQHLSFIA